MQVEEKLGDARRGGFDLLFGGSESDTITGGDADDQAFGQGGTATANGTRVRFDRITPAPFAIDIGTSEKLFSTQTAATTSSQPPEISQH